MKKLRLLLTALIFLFSVIVAPKSVFAGAVPESSSGNTTDNWFFESIPYNVTFNSTLNGHTAVSDPSYDAPVVGPYGYLAPTQTYLLGQTVTVKFRIRNQASSTKTIRGYLSYFVMSNLNNGDTTSCNLSPNFNYINKPNLDPGVDERSLFYDNYDRNYSGYSCQIFSGYGTGPSGSVLSDWTVGPDQIAEVTFNFTPTQAGYYQWDVPFGPWCRNDWSNVTPASASSTSSPCDSGSSQQSVAGFIRVIKPNDAKCVNITPPSGTIISGNNYSASVTMENLGHNPWTVGGGYRLGSQNTPDTLWGLNRANLSSTVNPYTNASFNFNVTAPAAGTQSFNWQMVQDGVGWFGTQCTSSVPVISPSPTSTPSPMPTDPLYLSVNCSPAHGTTSSANIGDTVIWTANPIGGTGSYSYSWSGTDGLTGSSQAAVKIYDSTGSKTASVTVTSGGLTTASDCGTVNVTASSIIVSCNTNKASVNIGTSVTYNATAYGGAGSPYTYNWSGAFNDSQTAGNEASQIRSYSTSGTKAVNLQVSSGGQTGSTSCPSVAVLADTCAIGGSCCSANINFNGTPNFTYFPGQTILGSISIPYAYGTLPNPTSGWSDIRLNITGSILSAPWHVASLPLDQGWNYSFSFPMPNSRLASYPLQLSINGIICSPRTYFRVVDPYPPLTTVSTTLACIDPGYSGSGFTVSWTNGVIPVSWVDFSTISSPSPDFSSYYHKAVGGFSHALTTTDAPNGFNGYIGVSGPLTLNPATNYWTRTSYKDYDNNVQNSTATYFTTPPACRHSLTVRACLDSNRDNSCSGEAGWIDFINTLSVSVTQAGSSVGSGTIGRGSDRTTFNLPNGAYSVSVNLPAALTGSYTIPFDPRDVTISGTAQTVEFAIQPPLPPPTATPALSPYFQTLGGDVHSNESINVNH